MIPLAILSAATLLGFCGGLLIHYAWSRAVISNLKRRHALDKFMLEQSSLRVNEQGAIIRNLEPLAEAGKKAIASQRKATAASAAARRNHTAKDKE